MSIDEGRPIPLLVAVVMVGLLGLCGLITAPLLLGQAASAEQLDDHLGAIGSAILLVAGIAMVAMGVTGIAGAVGIWKRQPWGWVAGALTTTVVTLGTLAAMALSETGTPLVLGAVLGAAGMIAVWWPATRQGCGI